MAVLKQTSPTAWPVAPKPVPSRTVPSASTRRAVGLGSDQPELSCLLSISRLDSHPMWPRQSESCLFHKEFSMLRDDINNALKEAMKARNERHVSTLRLMNAAIKDKDIEARGNGKGPLTDEELLSVFQKMVKQRQESADLYEKGGRPELAKQEN